MCDTVWCVKARRLTRRFRGSVFCGREELLLVLTLTFLSLNVLHAWWCHVVHVWVVRRLTHSVPSALQCSSWLLDCWSTPSASTLHWSGPSAGTLTSTTLASVRSDGATCWLSLESCSLSSCPFLPNTHQRSSCPPPLYPRCYSVVKNVSPLLTTLSNVGSTSRRDTRIPSLKAMLFGKPHSTLNNKHCLPASVM